MSYPRFVLSREVFLTLFALFLRSFTVLSTILCHSIVYHPLSFYRISPSVILSAITLCHSIVITKSYCQCVNYNRVYCRTTKLSFLTGLITSLLIYNKVLLPLSTKLSLPTPTDSVFIYNKSYCHSLLNFHYRVLPSVC